MSANVERLRAVYSEWARGNMGAGVEIFAPDVAIEPSAPGAGPVVGVAAFAGFMRDFLGQWRDFTVEAIDFAESGDTIVVTERQRATGAASGIETEATFHSTWTFRDGLAVRIRWEND